MKQPMRPKAWPSAKLGASVSKVAQSGIFVFSVNSQTASAVPKSAP